MWRTEQFSVRIGCIHQQAFETLSTDLRFAFLLGDALIVFVDHRATRGAGFAAELTDRIDVAFAGWRLAVFAIREEQEHC